MDDLTDELATRAAVDVIYGATLQIAKNSAHCVTKRNQPGDWAFLRVAWPYKTRGNSPFLLCYKRNGRTQLTLYLLAASNKIRSELDNLDSPVTEGLAHNDHAYQLLWDYVAKANKGQDSNSSKSKSKSKTNVKGRGKADTKATSQSETLELVNVLKVLTRLNRQADVAVVYCQRMEDTLLGKKPVVPEYMAGHELLNAVNEDVIVGGTSSEASALSNQSTPAIASDQLMAAPTSFQQTLNATANSKFDERVCWDKDQAIEEINLCLSEHASAEQVKVAITPVIGLLHSPFQPQDHHQAVSLVKSQLLDWRISGIASSDSMDFEVGEQMELLEDVYRVAAWQEAVKGTARRINLVAQTFKIPQVTQLEL